MNEEPEEPNPNAAYTWRPKLELGVCLRGGDVPGFLEAASIPSSPSCLCSIINKSFA